MKTESLNPPRQEDGEIVWKLSDVQQAIYREMSYETRRVAAEETKYKRAPRKNPEKSTLSVRDVTSNPDRYAWKNELARGGLGSVTQAHDQNLMRDVAIKELLPKSLATPGMVERFVDEAIITGHLEHPGIVPVYEVGVREDGCPFYVMKLLDGHTLADEINVFHNLDRKSAEWSVQFHRLLQTFISVCRSMAFAHHQQVVHRDLKPGNVVVGKFGEAVIVDWGLAKFFNSATDTVCLSSDSAASASSPLTNLTKTKGCDNAKTQTGQILGTPAYLSPEQARGNLRLNGKSDVYALGVMLYEILAGKPAFEGEDTQTIIQKVREGTFESPRKISRQIPAALNAICLQAMRNRAEDRYASAEELAAEVERFLAGERVLAHQESFSHRVLRWSRKHKSAVVSFIAALTITALVAGTAAVMVNEARNQEAVAKVQAQQERDQALAAQREKHEALKIALNQLSNSRKAADTWLIETSGDIEFYPGFRKLRGDWLRQAVAHYQEFANCPATTDELKNETGLSLLRLGDVHRLLQQKEQAEQAYAKAEHVFASIDDKQDTKLSKQLHIAQAKLGLGLTQLEQKPKLALELVDSASEICDRLVRVSPNDLDGLATRTRCQIANARSDLNDSKKSLTLLRNAIRDLRFLFEETKKPKYGALLANANLERGRLAQQVGDQTTASESFEDCDAIFQKLIELSPERPDYHEGRMTCLILLGNAYVSSNRSSQAIQCYRESIAEFETVIALMYRGEYHSENFAIAQINLGQLLDEIGDRENALESFSLGKGELAGLIRLHGQEPQLLMQFAQASFLLAKLQQRTKNVADARTELQTACEVFQHLIDRKETDDDMRRDATTRLQKCHALLRQLNAETS